jgi:hypothetical protein
MRQYLRQPRAGAEVVKDPRQTAVARIAKVRFLMIAAFRAHGRLRQLSARSGLLALTEGSSHHSPKIDH